MTITMTLDEYQTLLNTINKLENENKVLKNFLDSKKVNYNNILEQAKRAKLILDKQNIDKLLDKYNNKEYYDMDLPFVF